MLPRHLFPNPVHSAPSYVTIAATSLLVGSTLLGCSSGRWAKKDVPQARRDTVVKTTPVDAQQMLLDESESLFQLASASTRSTSTQQVSTVAAKLPNSTTAIETSNKSDGVVTLAENLTLGDSEMIESVVAATASITAPLRPRDSNSVPDHFFDMTEAEMLSIAMANSPVLRPLGIRIVENPAAVTTVYDPAIASTDPFFGPAAALSEFDTRLSAGLSSQNNDRVFNNATLGGDVQELTQDLATLNTGVQKRGHSGTLFDFNTVHGYDNNNRAGNSFPNYWENQYEVGVRQPILQGGGREFNLIAGPNARPGFKFSNGIWIARLNNRISDAEFEIELRNFVRDLYSVYWDLKRQYKNYENVLAAESVAYDTWQSVWAKADSGVTGGEANKEAQARAKYYSYRRQAQIALGGDGSQDGLYVVERRLRQMIGLPVVDSQLIRPIDAVATAPITFDYDALISRAMTYRTELMNQSLRVRKEELLLVAAKNFLLPQLDLIGRYRLRGFGDDLAGNDGGQRFASAYKDFFSLDHQEFEFGVEMGVTAGRRQAHAAVRHAALQINRERVVLAEQQRAVQHQISDAHAGVASTYAAMETSTAQVEASRTRLESSEVLFEADKLQIEFLLDAQEELLRAETQLAGDQTRYAMALVEINAATGSLLSDLGIHVQDTACRTHTLFMP
ncbi:Outer membrane efflux protein [Rubripirellula tenax]|uniref:Outer membrane efflux protein n=1 Tax=Rubripirellula tenax TaxID=2528015 RepID=A0A5C6FFB5_9BACT|nr:TolC family protein [Rubripirellula tenax]TWU58836.1 Outer membrane efflux protein [Rubripirellula tenax]